MKTENAHGSGEVSFQPLMPPRTPYIHFCLGPLNSWSNIRCLSVGVCRRVLKCLSLFYADSPQESMSLTSVGYVWFRLQWISTSSLPKPKFTHPATKPFWLCRYKLNCGSSVKVVQYTICTGSSLRCLPVVRLYEPSAVSTRGV